MQNRPCFFSIGSGVRFVGRVDEILQTQFMQNKFDSFDIMHIMHIMRVVGARAEQSLVRIGLPGGGTRRDLGLVTQFTRDRRPFDPFPDRVDGRDSQPRAPFAGIDRRRGIITRLALRLDPVNCRVVGRTRVRVMHHAGALDHLDQVEVHFLGMILFRHRLRLHF